ncbi:MAG: phosphotransferase family protein [Alphaproteobacteria bacterium]|nr:phosphotransferase family protein [Alphaproteobacteria bacterium]
MSAGVELIAVRPQHRFDETVLHRYLAARLRGFGGPLSVRQFEGGQSNPTFQLDCEGQSYVLRKKPPGKLLPSAHAVDREYRVMRALADTAVPVPRVLHLCQDDGVIGTAFFVMQKVEGRVLRDPLLRELPPIERRQLYDHFIAVLAALHKIDFAAVGLADFGPPGNYYARQIGRWSKQYLASKTEEIEAMDRLMAWLPANIPACDETAIVHGDFRIENAVVHASEPRIVAVLDWELSTLGHPFADLSYCCLGYRGDVGSSVGSLQAQSHAATGVPNEQEFLQRYCRLTGRDSIPGWDFYVAFSLFRLAAIGQGVYKRGLDGIAASARAASFGQVCRQRSELAWKIVTARA